MPRAPQPAPDGRVQAIGYLRVSTAEQADSGAGLAAQRAALTAAAEVRGWDLRILADAGVSAGDAVTADKRPALAIALEQLAAGHAQALMVAKLDRLSRSVAHGAGLFELAQRQHWALVALDLAVDTSTPTGEMFGNLLLTMARFEKRLIGQRTRDALAVKKAAGVRLGRPPALPPTSSPASSSSAGPATVTPTSPTSSTTTKSPPPTAAPNGGRQLLPQSAAEAPPPMLWTWP